MDKKSADAVNAGFNELMAENFAVKRMLAALFAASPEATAWLRQVDLQWVRDELAVHPVNDAFIARVLQTVEVVRKVAERTPRG